MKKGFLFTLIVFASVAFLTSSSCTAQTAPEYKAHADGWLVDVNKAYELSKQTNKPIMANFTGSDWCG
ncbi:MAG: hypothetical protein HKO56_02780, partial [Bacteroidia bacterium]|nr:hypothetical protein [Bacteroidia bacterium]